MRFLLLYVCLAAPLFAASPVTCSANADVTTAAAYNTPANWSGCASDGGAGLSFRGSTGTAIAAGVPGAAGKKDRIRTNGHIVNTGNLHIQVGDATASEVAIALIVDASGSFTVGDGGVAELDGYNTTAGVGGLAQIARNGQFKVSCGGTLIVNAFSNVISEFQNLGRLNIGDSTCGAWVQATAATPGSFAAYTGGSGVWSVFNSQTLPTVAVGDLVIIDPIPLPATTGSGALGPPYSAFGSTIPATAPVVGTMPIVSFGVLPKGLPLCVTGISPITVGLPTSTAYSCAGATALAFSNSGIAPLYLKKFAWLKNAQTQDWTTAQTKTAELLNARGAKYDALISRYSITGPIANAAGDGPGRQGDTSINITAISVVTGGGTSYSTLNARKNRESEIAVAGDWWAEENSGRLSFFGAFDSVTITMTWKTLATTINVGNPVITSPSGGVTGNEMNLVNAYVNPLNGANATSVIQAKGYDTSLSNGGFNIHHSTIYSQYLVDTRGMTGSASVPINMESNAIYGGAAPGGGVFTTRQGSSYLDFSNTLMSAGFDTRLLLGDNTTHNDNPHMIIAGVFGAVDNLLSAYSFSGNRDTYSDGLLQRIRIESTNFPGGSPGMIDGVCGTVGHPLISEWNYFYAAYISHQYCGETDMGYEFSPWNAHHAYVHTRNNGDTYAGNYAPGIKLHNLIVTEDTETCLNTGYQTFTWLDSPVVKQNTCLGNQAGGIGIGDVPGDNPYVSMVSGATFASHIIFTPLAAAGQGFLAELGFAKGGGEGGITSYQCVSCGGNALFGTVSATKYYAPATHADNQPLVTFNRFTLPTGISNVTGVTLQNPTYTSVGPLTLAYTRTSASNMTLAYGSSALAQLNYSGAGTTWTGGAANDVSLGGYGYIASTGIGGSGDYTAGCPQGNWLVNLTHPATLAILRCASATGAGGTSADSLMVSPAPIAAGYISGDTLVLVCSQVRLYSGGAALTSGCVNAGNASASYVDAGIDPRSLAGSSQSDTSVSMALTDYCASGCSSGLTLGLPGGNNATDYTADVSNGPINPVLPPSQGGDVTQAFVCGAGNIYTPAGTAWLTSALDGSYIGAVAPCVTAQSTTVRVGTVRGSVVIR